MSHGDNRGPKCQGVEALDILTSISHLVYTQLLLFPMIFVFPSVSLSLSFNILPIAII